MTAMNTGPCATFLHPVPNATSSTEQTLTTYMKAKLNSTKLLAVDVKEQRWALTVPSQAQSVKILDITLQIPDLGYGNVNSDCTRSSDLGNSCKVTQNTQ